MLTYTVCETSYTSSTFGNIVYHLFTPTVDHLRIGITTAKLVPSVTDSTLQHDL